MMYYHLTAIDNLDAILQNGLQPRAGVSRTYDTYLGPAVFLFPSLSDVQNALMNWYGEAHEQEETVLLHVDIDPEDYNLQQEEGAWYEVYTAQPISVSCIKIVEFLE